MCDKIATLKQQNIMLQYISSQFFHQLLKPSKQDTINQCCFNVGTSSTTLAQHQTNIGSMCLMGMYSIQNMYHI